MEGSKPADGLGENRRDVGVSEDVVYDTQGKQETAKSVPGSLE